MAREKTIEKIICLIHEINQFEEIQRDTELIKSGILNSLGIFELVCLLETEFGMEIPEDRFVPENFSSAAVIAELIMELTAKDGKE
ncbi:MAG: acyl carrier protein [Spirochaetaceae bacterium]|jgi:acyl carrier protein|nr:acyl carrier protein [Spirochaetaceae bacterium]